MKLVRTCIAMILAVSAIGGCTGTGLIGLPSLQDGTWVATPQVLLGGSSYIFQVSLDRLVRVNVGGVEWTLQQSFPASRAGTLITWKAIAQAPSGFTGILLPATTLEFTVAVTPQADGTMTGSVTQAIPTIPGIASIPTGTTMVTMRRI